MGAEEGDAVGTALLFQAVQSGLAPDAAFLPNGDRQRLLFGGNAAFARRPYQLFADKDFGLVRTGNPGIAGYQRHVDPLRTDTFHQRPGILHDHIDGHGRMGFGEAPQHVRQEAFGHVVRRAEPHFTRHVGHEEPRHGFAVQGQHAPRMFEQDFAFSRQADRARIAHQYRPAQCFLELLDLHGDRRWRAVHGIGGRSETAGIDDGDEAAQDVEIKQGDSVADFWGRSWHHTSR